MFLSWWRAERGHTSVPAEIYKQINEASTEAQVGARYLYSGVQIVGNVYTEFTVLVTLAQANFEKLANCKLHSLQAQFN